MSIILAADMCPTVCTVAICQFDDDAEVILAETVVESGRLHAERLVGMVDWALGATGLSLSDIDMLAVGIGPGSFTGLRIGVATFKGLALGASVGLVGVSSLDALARLAPVQQGTVAVLSDARMGEVFGALYQVSEGRITKLTEDRACPVDALLTEVESGGYFLGDGAALYAERIQAVLPEAHIDNGLHSAQRASSVAAEANTMLCSGVASDAALVSPVYIRASQAEVNRDLKGGSVKKVVTADPVGSYPEGDGQQ